LLLHRPHIYGASLILERIRKTILHHVIRTVDHIARNAAPSNYDDFVALLRPSDTIVSFNWDTLLDRALGTTTPHHIVMLGRIGASHNFAAD
jgi:hypothetical protein